MKLVVQIPCLNEEKSIVQTLKDIPRSIPGVDVIERLVVDDGSSDNTVRVAREHGAEHVISLSANRGLAHAFRAGMEESLRLGADIIVNTDGDGQYKGDDIIRLVRPILNREADFVIGVRDIVTIHHFSLRKKMLQRFGSWVVRRLSGTEVRDVTSGFRAFSREAATRLDLVTDYTHTIETIIALGKERESIAQIPIETNHKVRESRLMTSMSQYVSRCGADMVRIYIRYESLKTFARLGAFSISLGFLAGVYYLFDRLIYDGRSFVALAFFSLLLISGLLFIMLGFLGDSIACNRRMLSNITRILRRM